MYNQDNENEVDESFCGAPVDALRIIGFSMIAVVLVVLLALAVLVDRAGADGVHPLSPMFASREVVVGKDEAIEIAHAASLDAEPEQTVRDPQNPYTIFEIPCGIDGEITCTSRTTGRP